MYRQPLKNPLPSLPYPPLHSRLRVEDGTALAIECNPRFSSNNTSFYDNEKYGDVLLNGLFTPEAFSSEKTPVQPLESAREVNWLFCDAYYALTKSGYSIRERISNLYTAFFENKDAYFDVNDPGRPRLPRHPPAKPAAAAADCAIACVRKLA